MIKGSVPQIYRTVTNACSPKSEPQSTGRKTDKKEKRKIQFNN